MQALRIVALLAGVGCFTLGTAWAQREQQGQYQQRQNTAQGQAKVGADRDFALKAMMGGMMEVKLGQFAAENAANASVRQLGQKLVQDHTQANKELMTIAGKEQIQFPREMSKEHQDLWNRLSAFRGADFDKHFVQHVIADHQKDIAEFEREAKDGQDPQLKAFAAKTLPTLREHLKLAQDVAGKLGIQGTEKQR
jgi:putative membrane protein